VKEAGRSSSRSTTGRAFQEIADHARLVSSAAEFLICQEGADWRAARAPGLRVALRVSLVDRPARKGPRRKGKGKGSDFEYA